MDSTKLENEILRNEIERLTKALHYEQHWLGRIGTHGPGCWSWGPAHYECALMKIKGDTQELLKALKRAEPFIEGRMLDCEAIYDDSKDGWHYESYATARNILEQTRAVIAKAEGQA